MRTQQFRLSVIVRRSGDKSDDVTIEVSPEHTGAKEAVRRKLRRIKLKKGLPYGTFSIEATSSGHCVSAEDFEVEPRTLEDLIELADQGYDDMLSYQDTIERFMAGEGLQEADRIAAAIIKQPELFVGVDDVQIKVMEMPCPFCGQVHRNGRDRGGLVDMLRSLGSIGSLLGFGKKKDEKEPVLVFRVDSNGAVASSPLFNKADLQVRLVEAVKQRLVVRVQATDVALAMAKVRDQEGIAHNNATFAKLQMVIEAANASNTQHLAAVALEAEGLKLFAETLRASGLEVSTPACDEAYPEAPESTTATDIGADDKDPEVQAAPADDSAGRVKSPAHPAIQAAPAASGITDGSDDDAPVVTA